MKNLRPVLYAVATTVLMGTLSSVVTHGPGGCHGHADSKQHAAAAQPNAAAADIRAQYAQFAENSLVKKKCGQDTVNENDKAPCALLNAYLFCALNACNNTELKDQSLARIAAGNATDKDYRRIATYHFCTVMHNKPPETKKLGNTVIAAIKALNNDTAGIKEQTKKDVAVFTYLIQRHEATHRCTSK